MNIFAAIINGLRELWANKIRSLLSMSGIILGVAALIAMVTVVQGMMGGFRKFVELQGGIEKISIAKDDLPKEQEHLSALSVGITMRDVKAIEVGAPLVRYIAPEIRAGWERITRPGNEMNTRVTGVTPDWLPVNKRKLATGRFIADLDLLQKTNVAVLGAYTADVLFTEHEDPIGQTIKIRGTQFVIVGVLEPVEPPGQPSRGNQRRGSRSGINRWMNNDIYIPLQTAISRYTGNDTLTTLNVSVAKAEDVIYAVPQIENILIQTHDGLQDFSINTNETMLAEFQKTEASFTFSLGGVAGISLFVGAIGIMNVMLASINERIREIGVRKAIGARGSDIFFQFLAEAGVISCLGGIIGLGVSFGIIFAMNMILSNALPDAATSTVKPVIMLAGLAFSMGVGLLAGIYPAVRAAKLDPIEALRYE
ncbi:MAG: ABC transporter permease [Puniceicoccales bacterium]|jgi:ABC-type antimicrobial peptide transport system permease subunit|nr:ABC transporter permease [Puniceicoccales bacterium]